MGGFRTHPERPKDAPFGWEVRVHGWLASMVGRNAKVVGRFGIIGEGSDNRRFGPCYRFSCREDRRGADQNDEQRFESGRSFQNALVSNIFVKTK
jgi:hypothetical protein